jgi:hypothetical protein
MTIWKPGRRLFTVAAVLMLLTASAHTIGALSPWPDGPAERKLLAEMRGYVLSMGLGMNPSVFDIYRDLSFTMSITLAALGIMNLVLAASRDATDALLRRAGWVNAVWVGAFLALNYAFQIPPPLLCAVVIEAVVLLALFVPSRGQLAPGALERQ